MVAQQPRKTCALDRKQTRDRESCANTDKSGPGAPAPPGILRPMGQRPALSNPSWLVLLLPLHYTATCHLLSTSSLPFLTVYARSLVFARLSLQSKSLCSQAHTFFYKLSKEFFNRLVTYMVYYLFHPKTTAKLLLSEH